MGRQTKKTAILAKIETTYGTDAAPTGAADALLVSDASFDTSYNNVDRNLIRGYLGNSEQLAGTRFVQAAFSVELSGSGTAGTAPAWGKLLQACAMAETVAAGSYVEYTPVSSAFKSLTIYYYLDGELHKALGCMGTVSLDMTEGTRPLLKFTFTGIDGGLTAVATPSLTLSAWKAPLVISDPNTGDITLGGTYATGAITGGTPYPSRGFTLDMGNDVKQMAVLGGQGVDIIDRNPTGSIQLELTAAQEVAMFADINANTLTTLSLLHGTTAGAKVLVHGAAVQRINPKHVDYEGRPHLGMDLRFTPVAGNDELRIVAL